MPYEPDGHGDESGAEYEPEDDGPEARAFREEAYIEEKALAWIETLLASLTPEDLTRPLFTFSEHREWNIPESHRPPPRT